MIFLVTFVDRGERVSTIAEGTNLNKALEKVMMPEGSWKLLTIEEFYTYDRAKEVMEGRR